MDTAHNIDQDPEYAPSTPQEEMAYLRRQAFFRWL
jgi:hypothetical protein